MGLLTRIFIYFLQIHFFLNKFFKNSFLCLKDANGLFFFYFFFSNSLDSIYLLLTYTYLSTIKNHP
ncbi:hypothetical protein BY996DRAFT_7425600 [Phakopsora pachyrhizi]|nr:hypothetical protein BY996DRAFT_7425600 [Phakopsora pachyrhizi]